MRLSRDQLQVLKDWARYVRHHATQNAHRHMREVSSIIVRSPSLIVVAYAPDMFADPLASDCTWVTLPPIDRQSWGSWRNDALLQEVLAVTKREVGEVMPTLYEIERHFGLRN